MAASAKASIRTISRRQRLCSSSCNKSWLMNWAVPTHPKGRPFFFLASGFEVRRFLRSAVVWFDSSLLPCDWAEGAPAELAERSAIRKKWFWDERGRSKRGGAPPAQDDQTKNPETDGSAVQVGDVFAAARCC